MDLFWMQICPPFISLHATYRQVQFSKNFEKMAKKLATTRNLYKELIQGTYTECAKHESVNFLTFFNIFDQTCT